MVVSSRRNGMALNQPTNNEMALQMVHCGPVLEDDLELIVMILQYLPVKSLGRFMTVCKSWNVVIREQSFIEMQLNRSKENPQHIVLHSSVLRPTVDHSLTVHTAIACWNGLIFQQSICSSPSPPCEKLCVLNPITLQRFELPGVEVRPYSKEHCFGVAYGPRCYDYKVYKFVGASLLIDTAECQMYSSITGCWKSLGVPPAYPLYSFYVCLNGTVYWQISKGREDFPGAILAIDELDNFRTFDLPELESGWPYLVTLGDSLGLVVIYKEVVGVSRMSIWVLESLHRTWMKKLEISIPLFPLELTVSAAAWGNRVVITTPRRFLTYHIDWKDWTFDISADIFDSDCSTFSGFLTESLLPCNGAMEPMISDSNVLEAWTCANSKRSANRPANYDSDNEFIYARQGVRQPLIRPAPPATGVPVTGALDQRPSKNMMPGVHDMMREKVCTARQLKKEVGALSCDDLASNPRQLSF